MESGASDFRFVEPTKAFLNYPLMENANKTKHNSNGSVKAAFCGLAIGCIAMIYLNSSLSSSDACMETMSFKGRRMSICSSAYLLSLSLPVLGSIIGEAISKAKNIL